MQKIKRWMTPLLMLMILSMPLMPTLAQEVTQETQPTTAATAAPVMEATIQPAPPTSSDIPTETSTLPTDDILLIIGSIGLVFLIGGSFYMGLQGLEAAKIMVPPEVVDKITVSVVNTMKETFATMEQKAAATISPIDDAVVAVAKVPVEALIKELTSREMTAEQRSATIGAIAQSLELDLGTGQQPNPLENL